MKRGCCVAGGRRTVSVDRFSPETRVRPPREKSHKSRRDSLCGAVYLLFFFSSSISTGVFPLLLRRQRETRRNGSDSSRNAGTSGSVISSWKQTDKRTRAETTPLQKERIITARTHAHRRRENDFGPVRARARVRERGRERMWYATFFFPLIFSTFSSVFSHRSPTRVFSRTSESFCFCFPVFLPRKELNEKTFIPTENKNLPLGV